ncbi:hypothetical protein CEXT_22521 [Caerostris extrusa]|uniref:C2H2-type domain-containing protein n=1 Tax=Caerostris extrusa TaxID=172846 RepID=A0AAV4NNL6_CAEEX|nr:hypothetical protein CEXT_22521 [Caerostris extrusa]
MTTFAALHTKNINIPKRNCVGGAPVIIKFLKCEVCKRSYSSKSFFSNHLKRFKCLQPGNDTYPAVKDEINNTVSVVIALLFLQKKHLSQGEAFVHIIEGSKIPYVQKMMLFQLCAMLKD